MLIATNSKGVYMSSVLDFKVLANCSMTVITPPIFNDTVYYLGSPIIYIPIGIWGDSLGYCSPYSYALAINSSYSNSQRVIILDQKLLRISVHTSNFVDLNLYIVSILGT